MSWKDSLLLANNAALTFLSCSSLSNCKVEKSIDYSQNWGNLSSIEVVSHKYTLLPSFHSDIISLDGLEAVDVYIGTSSGLWILQSGANAPERVPNVNGTVTAIAVSEMKQEVAVSTPLALYIFNGIEW